MITKENIERLIKEKINGTPLFIVEINIKPGNIINVYLDSTEGVTIKDCVEVSRCIEKNFDRDTEDYALEVSSAGLNAPFKVKEQYLKNIGKNVRIKMIDGTIIKGLLKNYTDAQLSLEITKKIQKKPVVESLTIEHNQIIEIKSDIQFFKN